MIKLFKDKSESKAIASAIDFFQNGSFQENQSYIRLLAKGQSVRLNGFSFTRENYCYVVWKNDPDPRYKGQDLFKVVPRFKLIIKQIVKILETQSWTYV